MRVKGVLLVVVLILVSSIIYIIDLYSNPFKDVASMPTEIFVKENEDATDVVIMNDVEDPQLCEYVFTSLQALKTKKVRSSKSIDQLIKTEIVSLVTFTFNEEIKSDQMTTYSESDVTLRYYLIDDDYYILVSSELEEIESGYYQLKGIEIPIIE